MPGEPAGEHRDRPDLGPATARAPAPVDEPDELGELSGRSGPAAAAAGSLIGTQAAPGTRAADPFSGTRLPRHPGRAGHRTPPDRSPADPGPGTRAGTAGRRSGRPSRRSSGRRSTGSARGRLGAGLVDVPPVPRIDPASALLPTRRSPRRSGSAAAAASRSGRSRRTAGRARWRGVCPQDGTPFSFTPKLQPGDLVAGQYDVQGCLAHGGLGWIYLALDRNVENRWVVLKGLVDAGGRGRDGRGDRGTPLPGPGQPPEHRDDPQLRAAPGRGRHPGRLHRHGVRRRLLAQGAARGPPPATTARSNRCRCRRPSPTRWTSCPRSAHLHSLGLAYCDFKPENVIQYDRQLKLIDLGAVIRMDDRRSALFGTVGYQAPEIADRRPVAELGRVHRRPHAGRAGAGHVADPRGARRSSCPTRPTTRCWPGTSRSTGCCAGPPTPIRLRRFESADEMADQLAGVLREVLAMADGEPRPGRLHRVRAGPRRVRSGPADRAPASRAGPIPARVAARLPVPLVDPADDAAAAAGHGDGRRPRGGAAAGRRAPRSRARSCGCGWSAPTSTPAIRTRPARCSTSWPTRTRTTGGWTGTAASPRWSPAPRRQAIASVRRGLHRVARGARGEAGAGRRGRVRGPGRATPGAATGWWPGRTASQADALFGLARVRIRTGDRAGALRVLDAVPETSSRYVAAQLGAVQTILLGPDGSRGRRGRAAGGRGPGATAAAGPATDQRGAGHPARARPSTRSVPVRTRPPTRSSTARGRSASCGWRWSAACARRPG